MYVRVHVDLCMCVYIHLLIHEQICYVYICKSVCLYCIRAYVYAFSLPIIYTFYVFFQISSMCAYNLTLIYCKNVSIIRLFVWYASHHRRTSPNQERCVYRNLGRFLSFSLVQEIHLQMSNTMKSIFHVTYKYKSEFVILMFWKMISIILCCLRTHFSL